MVVPTTASATTTTMNDIPDVILSNIFASISDTRTQNSFSLVNRKFLTLEEPRAPLLAPRQHAGPLHDSAIQWPRLSRVKLVRWHQRPSSPHLGANFVPLFEHCKGLTCLNLSNFYYWTEDLPSILQVYSDFSKSLTCLDLLTVSLTDGFKAHEIQAITAACANLTKFLVACMFDPSYLGFIGDETLLAIAANCPKLSVLHLVDSRRWGTPGMILRMKDVLERMRGLALRVVDFFSGLPLLEELVLCVCKNVRDSAVALEALNSRCPRLKMLRLEHFHGICMAVESQLDGVALCSGL
ncbi:hypothetical protein GH714_015067 [Hevea brasiliensis]|uniref:F-box domain-containing protein n=1 Tax=Hevea brasiliensis TaxID=3981 RepID=A0A6A6KP07_HEVBR|nr:hypothetical protein GH714_015067 [Hevea brasiliensis]